MHEIRSQNMTKKEIKVGTAVKTNDLKDNSLQRD